MRNCLCGYSVSEEWQYSPMVYMPNPCLRCSPPIQVMTSNQDLELHSQAALACSPKVTHSGNARSRSGLYVLLLTTSEKSFEKNDLSWFDI